MHSLARPRAKDDVYVYKWAEFGAFVEVRPVYGGRYSMRGKTYGVQGTSVYLVFWSVLFFLGGGRCSLGAFFFFGLYWSGYRSLIFFCLLSLFLWPVFPLSLSVYIFFFFSVNLASVFVSLSFCALFSSDFHSSVFFLLLLMDGISLRFVRLGRCYCCSRETL